MDMDNIQFADEEMDVDDIRVVDATEVDSLRKERDSTVLEESDQQEGGVDDTMLQYCSDDEGRTNKDVDSDDE